LGDPRSSASSRLPCRAKIVGIKVAVRTIARLIWKPIWELSVWTRI